MTFNNAPWAIDGARSTAALARLGVYATGGGRSGVVKPSDLRVLPLAVPGNGLRITSGAGIILNHYLDDPDEVYAAANPGTHTVLAADMPAAIGSTGYYLVCVVVGDPEFDQSGHPFMPTTIAPEDAADFEYVRIVIVPCTAGTTSFEQLGYDYPAYALARLEIPPTTTTITSGMIVDLRELSQPRSQRKVFSQTFSVAYSLNYGDGSASYHYWTEFSPSIAIPPWATKATIICTMSGILATGGSTNGFTRAEIGGLVGPSVPYDEDPVPGGYSGGGKSTLVTAAELDVSSIAGTTTYLALQGSRDTGEPGYLTTWGGSQQIFDIQFDEDTI